MTTKEDALSYCWTHDAYVMDGEFCPVAESTGERCEYSADLRTCPECGKEQPDDDRVLAGMKCGPCAYGKAREAADRMAAWEGRANDV